ncbi:MULTISPECIES: ATP-binding protein [unclassified Duganella]|uniref:ATP-binding protein n=1 Tax=unclassified Duganella TaxID=2636909 RepID=UPI0009E79559|nr:MULTISPECIES: ATP-binding protein [unclassified Duganella]
MSPDPRTHNVLDSMGDGFAVIARDWTVQYLNPRAADMLLPPVTSLHDPRGQNLWHAFPALAGGALEAPLRRTLEQGLPAACELFYQPSQRWMEVRAWPSPLGMTCLLLDIHQRKLHERGLRESTNRLQVALAAGRLGDWEWSAATNQVRLGRRAAEIFELPAEIPITWPVLRDRIAAEDFEVVEQAFSDAVQLRRDFNVECRIRHRDGAICWLSVIGHGDFSDAGELRGVIGMMQDITARKSTEDALRNSEEELRALANSMPQLAWIASSDGAMMWYNERWQEYTGMDDWNMLGEGWRQVYAPEAIPAMLAHWRISVETGRPFEMEFPIRARDGQYRWFLTRANAMRDASGRILRWFGTSTDVDQVKRVQEQLRDETNILELLNSTGTALVQNRDLHSLLQDVTDAATSISGARFGAFFYHGADGDGGKQAMHTLSGAPPDDFQGLPHPHVRSGLAVPVLARAGEVVGTLFFGHPEPDMFNERTERIVSGVAAQAGIAIDNARMVDAAQRAAEERKVLLDRERSARAEAERSSQMKDEFLATLSHELRTPLTAILGWAQVLRRGNRTQEEQLRGLETIERNARAQAQLIEDLLDMGRITSGKVLLDMKLLMPAVVVDAALEAVRPAAEAKGIRLERDFSATGHVAGDANRLQQVVWNLLTNALKFTPRGGTVRASIWAHEGHVDITVSDNGLGIRHEFLPHVFERFRQADASTTRRHGGLGLGLSIVKHLVEQHGGTVAASSEGEGMGSSFSVRLPLASGEIRAARMHSPARSERAPLPELGLRDLAGLKVLLVDDEADARELVGRILRDCNCEVQCAANAAEAIALARGSHYDLLVSDIGMPDVDGFELLSRIRALGPARGGALPAIALTAFARPEDRLHALESGFLDHVPKPIEPSELVATIERVCHASKSG